MDELIRACQDMLDDPRVSADPEWWIRDHIDAIRDALGAAKTAIDVVYEEGYEKAMYDEAFSGPNS